MVANIFKPALIGAALLIFVWAFFAYFYQPNIQKMDLLNGEIVNLQKSVGCGKAILKERARFLSDESSVVKEIAFLKKRIPRSSSIPEVIHELSADAPACRIDIQAIEPSAPVKRTFSRGGREIAYEETPITLKISGDYQAIARYFHVIDDLPCLVVVKKISIKPEGDILIGNFELATYTVR